MKTHHLEHDDTIRCFHCGNIVPMKLIGRDVSTWDEGEPYIGVEEWSFYMCPTCKEPTLICYYWQQDDKEITSPVGRSVMYPNNLFDDRSIPENIRKAYMAAAATKSLDNSVSLLAWRRVLELTCKDLGAKGNSLYDQISDLSNFIGVFSEKQAVLCSLASFGMIHGDIENLSHIGQVYI